MHTETNALGAPAEWPGAVRIARACRAGRPHCSGRGGPSDWAWGTGGGGICVLCTYINIYIYNLCVSLSLSLALCLSLCVSL